MKRYRNSLASFLQGALVVGTLAATIAPAAAEGMLIADYEASPATINALMEPIQPFLGSEAGSTTSIIQLGEGNSAHAGINGNGSLAVIQQAGTGNRAVQAVEGHSSAALLVQGGKNNSVVQASRGDNNFQLVGVSGENNQIAYVQDGNSLAGVLDVRDSKNSTVVAIQTEQSGRYMMPTGLRGLENKTVVVVPGRMYVLPKR
ncbi:hypothetical protein [Shinella sedimenti]|uniref:Curlin associated repeat-containing protein n=1 Tax=Shinella sedimenti TaxID=2919913 RepID=A0ABT0CTS8_9HYPH|nr:hypothetical protein [Shinella sedimenti]MCJ8152014.1 hypothetical protein [Shinella sedimenti]